MPHLFGIIKENNIRVQHFILGYYLPPPIKIETANHNNMTKTLSLSLGNGYLTLELFVKHFLNFRVSVILV